MSDESITVGFLNILTTIDLVTQCSSKYTLHIGNDYRCVQIIRVLDKTLNDPWHRIQVRHPGPCHQKQFLLTALRSARQNQAR